MPKFWDKVLKCEHKNLSPNYLPYFMMCGTPYCGDISEDHCLDCGVYITHCKCMSEDGMSGWSLGRRRAWEKSKGW